MVFHMLGIQNHIIEGPLIFFIVSFSKEIIAFNCHEVGRYTTQFGFLLAKQNNRVLCTF